MKRSVLIVGSVVAMLGATHAARADGMADWSCSCLTFDGSSEACHMFASITGDLMSFGAFETGGEGPYSVETTAAETVVTGDLATFATGAPLKVIIVQPADGSDDLVFIDERTPGGETFTAHCEGQLP